MKNRKVRALLAGMCLAIYVFSPTHVQGQPARLSMDDVISQAVGNSVQSMAYRNGYAADYWEFRSFKASFRPFLNMSANLGGLNRSMVILQDYNTGNMAYRTNWSLTDEAQVSLTQNVPFTGGTISLATRFSRLDQYLPGRSVTYFTQPLYLSYSQSVRGFNSFRWDQRIKPRQHELSRREYMENMERVKASVVQAYWDYVSALDSYERSVEDYRESQRLYGLADRKFMMGTADRISVQQLELKLVEDSMTVSSRRLSLQMSHDALCSHMGLDDGTELELAPVFTIPDVTVAFDDVLGKVLGNSSYSLSNEIRKLQARENVERSKASAGLQSSVNLMVGLSGSDERLSRAVGKLQDQEIASVSISVPIVDWGEGQSRLRMARAHENMLANQLQQNLTDLRRELAVLVMEFNNMGNVCRLSRRAYDIAQDSYSDAISDFTQGRLTVTELNQIRAARDNARRNFIDNIAGFWKQYYRMRSITLWDYIEDVPIEYDFNQLETDISRD